MTFSVVHCFCAGQAQFQNLQNFIQIGLVAENSETNYLKPVINNAAACLNSDRHTWENTNGPF